MRSSSSWEKFKHQQPSTSLCLIPVISQAAPAAGRLTRTVEGAGARVKYGKYRHREKSSKKLKHQSCLHAFRGRFAQHIVTEGPARAHVCFSADSLQCDIDSRVPRKMQKCPRILSAIEQLRSCNTLYRGVSSSRDSTMEATVKDGFSKVASAFENALSPGGAWNPDKMPDLSNKTFLITGANSGIGYEAAQELANHNANVTIASRNQASGQRYADAPM